MKLSNKGKRVIEIEVKLEYESSVFLPTFQVLVLLASGNGHCAIACVDNSPCVSFNIAVDPDKSGRFSCELLANDKYTASRSFKASAVFHHYSLAVSVYLFRFHIQQNSVYGYYKDLCAIQTVPI